MFVPLAWSAQTAENSHSFFNASYTCYKSLGTCYVLYLLSGSTNKKWLDKTGQCNWTFLFNIEEATKVSNPNVYLALNLGRCIVLCTICGNTGCGVFKGVM